MTKIVADCCANHMGDRRIMEAMIKCAAEIGVDVVKFQSFKADNLRKDWPDHENAYKYYKQHELSENDHLWLIEKCQENGIEFLTTVFDLETVDFLLSIGIKKVKIASPDMMNWTLVDKCVGIFNEVIISTGMHSQQEISSLYFQEFIREANVKVLYCVSKYPAFLKDINWPELSMYNGFSDHTIGTEAGKTAIALHAEYLEKHFTLSCYLPGKDQKISGTPKDFAEIVEFRNNVGLMANRGMHQLDVEEIDNRKKYVRRWQG